MSIRLDDSIQTTLYTCGNDLTLWKVETFFSVPSVTMVNLKTGKKKIFGLDGLTDKSFRPAHSIPKEVMEVLKTPVELTK